MSLLKKIKRPDWAFPILEPFIMDTDPESLTPEKMQDIYSDILSGRREFTEEEYPEADRIGHMKAYDAVLEWLSRQNGSEVERIKSLAKSIMDMIMDTMNAHDPRNSRVVYHAEKIIEQLESELTLGDLDDYSYDDEEFSALQFWDPDNYKSAKDAEIKGALYGDQNRNYTHSEVNAMLDAAAVAARTLGRPLSAKVTSLGGEEFFGVVYDPQI